MNAAFKGLMLTSVLIVVIYSALSYTGMIYADILSNRFGDRNIQVLTYTKDTIKGHDLIIKIYGIGKDESLIIYDITVNRISVKDDPNLIHNKSLPIKLTSNNNAITISLNQFQDGQLVYLRLDTNLGPIFLTIKV